MIDRELLELAAKAAGIDLKFEVLLWSDGSTYPCYRDEESVSDCANTAPVIRWNPLTDDGDALRLAVKLNISIEFTCCQDDAPVVWCRHWDYAQRHANFPDPYAATRRAIVQAAAEIGKEVK